MIGLIVFSIGNNRYALNIDNIQRIIQACELSDIPNAHEYIDGMMSYEDSVLKVLSFRKLIGLKTYEDELSVLFKKLKASHEDWLGELVNSIDNGSAFTKTTDPHKCELGIWLDNFNSYDDRVSTIFKNLTLNHKKLHISGGDVLELYKNDKDSASEILKTEVYDIYNHTMRDIDIFIEELSIVSNSLQKLLIYENSGKKFAIKVDVIEDIAHIEDEKIMNSDEEHHQNDFLELDGVLDLDGFLVNLIKTINLPH